MFSLYNINQERLVMVVDASPLPRRQKMKNHIKMKPSSPCKGVGFSRKRGQYEGINHRTNE